MMRSLVFGMLLALAGCTTDAGSGVILRVAVWDHTTDGVTGQPEVWLHGGRDPWLPEMGSRLRRRAYTGFQVGTTETFVFDPLGNNQFEISVEVPITDALCPAGCNADTLNLGIWDDYFAVWGPVEQRIVER